MRITIAIFAAFVLTCLAKPISSSVGARHVFAAESQEKTYTAADYIQDGLVALWDGIENVGWGSHDRNSSVWVDLVGERDAELSGTYVWDDDGWVVSSVSGRGLAKWNGINLPRNQTIEILILPISSTSYGRIIAEGQGIPSPQIRGGSISDSRTLAMYGYGLYSSSFVYDSMWPNFNLREFHLHSIAHPSGGPMIYYIDGIPLWTRATSQDSTGSQYGYFANRGDYGRGLDAKYFCVRIYDRALSELEINYNRAIDNERFGL